MGKKDVNDSSSERLEGEVKFYNQRKNYGFIIPEDDGEDVYFKGRDVKKGWLEGGETVEFTRKPSENHRGKNPRARNIIKKESWWSKKKIAGIALTAFLILAFAHVYHSFSNSEYRITSLQLNDNKILSGGELTATASVKNTTEPNSPIIKHLQNYEVLNSKLVDFFGKSQSINLEVDGKVVESKNVKVGMGHSENINFDLIRKNPGYYNVRVDSFTENFQVTNTAKFELNNFHIDPSDPWISEKISFSVKVRNVGAMENTKTLRLDIGDKNKEKEITLSPEEERSVSFSAILEETGNFEATVSEGTDQISQKLSVSTPSGSPLDRLDYYYGTAEIYVKEKYQVPEEKDIQGLASFLNQLKFRGYDSDIFSCSESSARLEWLLEGAGFNALLATHNVGLGHAWVVVKLEDKDVAIEATRLAEGDVYTPPGIIMKPDGSFKKYSWKYKKFQEWKEKYPPSQYAYDPNMTLEEWEAQYLGTVIQPIGIPTEEGYYSPEDTYKNPEDALSGWSGWDWWNASPYSQTSPFSEWD